MKEPAFGCKIRLSFGTQYIPQDCHQAEPNYAELPAVADLPLVPASLKAHHRHKYLLANRNHLNAPHAAPPASLAVSRISYYHRLIPVVFSETAIVSSSGQPLAQDDSRSGDDRCGQQREFSKWRLHPYSIRVPSRCREHHLPERRPGQPGILGRPDEHGRQGPRGARDIDDRSRQDPRWPAQDQEEDPGQLTLGYWHPGGRRMSCSIPHPPSPRCLPSAGLPC